MAHISLYRQLRPKTFAEVVGQDNTIATLTNQIELDRIAHAYLFTGTRGTGKTSTAKILARAANCEQLNGANPCNVCQTCQSILNDANIDVIEMDAASNNGVDDIRELREIVKFPPSSCRYKVMIIDEVHMLSKGAFNALLKTLEEPPEYIIFILATTEPHKVPATISSRCQHFSFKHIEDDVMRENLAATCDALEITVEQDALNLIVKLADGALRDAYSLLEQAAAYCGSELSYQGICEALGRSSDDAVEQLADAIIARDQMQIIDLLATHYHAGKDMTLLLDDLIGLFRCAMIATMTGDVASTTLLPAWRQWLSNTVDSADAIYWQGTLNKLLSTAQTVKYATHPWLQLEVNLLELCTDTQIDTALVDRVATLENQLAQLLNGKQPVKLPTVPTAAQKAPQPTAQDSVKQAKVLQDTDDKAVPSTKHDTPPAIEQSSEEHAETVVQLNANALSLADIVANWQPFLEQIKNILPTTCALMKKVEPIAYHNGKLVLQLDAALKVLKPNIMKSENISNIKQAFQKTFNSDVQIDVVDADCDHEDALRAYFKGVVDDANIIIK